MKELRTILLGITMLMTSTMFAQIQNGFVKNIGRPNSPGKGIGGVAIRFTGVPNAVITSSDGHFTLNIPNKKVGDEIKLLSVRKNGFELKDRDMIGRSFIVSPTVPLQIVMISEAQLYADKQRIEQNAIQVADRNYKSKLKQLEQSVKDSKITEIKYRQELHDLEQNYEKYMSLIGDMAERYARTDYDGLDDIDAEINVHIENGELECADSLILSVFDPNTVLERNRKAKEEVNNRIGIAQRALDKLYHDKEAINKDIEGAKRTIELGKKLAEEYISKNEIIKAKECYNKILALMISIYGENSPEVNEIRLKLSKIE